MIQALLLPEIEQNTPAMVVPQGQVRKMQSISGEYITGFITEQEEVNLLKSIDKERWLDDLQRRVQHYGYRYDYKSRKIDDKDRIGKLPSWTNWILDRLFEKNVFQEKPEQIIVNEYLPGQGIAPHIDRDCFGPTLASLSLGGACIMHLAHGKNENKKFDIILEPCSLVVYKKESRYEWKHSIVARQRDKVADKIYARKRRVSLTFRTIA